MMCSQLAALFFLISVASGFVPQGDYRHLFPSLCIGIKVSDNEHVLPYFMGLIEELRYPKDRTNIMFFAKPQSLAVRWMQQFPRDFYRLLMQNEYFVNWREESLVFGRSKNCGFLLIMDTDCFLLRDSIRQLISLDKLAVSPLLISPFGGQSNVHGLLGDEFVLGTKKEIIRVYYTNGPLLIKLKHVDSSYLTFDQNNLLSYQGTGDPIDVFAYSAYSLNIPIEISNLQLYGYFISSEVFNKAKHMALFGSFLASWVSNVGPMPFPTSVVLPPWYPIPIKFGFDMICLINLDRRPERLAKMEEVLRLVGIDFTRFSAVDGQNITERELSAIRFLPDYEDPYYKRPMKLGEIGCFLSHLKIWEDVVQKGYQKVIVLEDDVRFTKNGTLILKSLVEDLVKTQLDWDFIYLGRKRMAAASEEAFVPGHNFLSTVVYSYWTIGYALSLSGASKLIASRPLDRLLTLDEFLPILFDRHPNVKWTSHFPSRNLRAFAAFPSVVEPERYTNQPGYVSDTEGSKVVGEMESTSIVAMDSVSFSNKPKDEL